jgi:hypothetical protein
MVLGEREGEEDRKTGMTFGKYIQGKKKYRFFKIGATVLNTKNYTIIAWI